LDGSQVNEFKDNLD